MLHNSIVFRQNGLSAIIGEMNISVAIVTSRGMFMHFPTRAVQISTR